MSHVQAAQNAYDKAKVMAACEAALKSIKEGREEYKKHLYSGKKEYWLFGRELTVEEAYAQRGDDMMVECLYALQERIVVRILSAARFAIGDIIYLTQDELSQISGYWNVGV